MSVFTSGLTATLFYTLALGVLWPPNTKVQPSGLFLGSIIAKALWLSWLVVVSVFAFPDLDPLWVLLPIVIAVTIIRLKLAPPQSVVISIWPWIAAGLTVVAMDAVVGLSAFDYFDHEPYALSGWDINASWNAWAIQMTQGKYSPYSSPYPLLLPGLWSLIYRAQGDVMAWVFPVFANFSFMLLAVAIAAGLFQQKLRMVGVVYTLTLAGLVLNTPTLLGGQPDAILMLLLLATGGALTAAFSECECYAEWLLLSVILGSLAAITKQAGFGALVLVIIALALIMSPASQRFWRSAAMATFPLVSFFAIYHWSSLGGSGEITDLAALTANSAAGAGMLEHGWSRVSAITGGIPLFFLLALSSLNFLFGRPRQNWVGLLFLFGFGLMFVAYARCCAYDARNGWFLVSLLATSAMFGVLQFEEITGRIWRLRPDLRGGIRQKASTLSTVILAACAVAVGIAGATVDGPTFQQFAEGERRKIVWSSVNELAYRVMENYNPPRIISTYQFFGILPEIEGKYIQCSTVECVSDGLSSNRDSVIITGPRGFQIDGLDAIGDFDQIDSEPVRGFTAVRLRDQMAKP